MNKKPSRTAAIDAAIDRIPWSTTETAAEPGPAITVPGRLAERMVGATRDDVIKLREQVKHLQDELARVGKGGEAASSLGFSAAEQHTLAVMQQRGFDLVLLEPEIIKRPFLARRSDKHFETDEFAHFLASIEREGQQIPGYVRPLEDGSYELIVGRRRAEACRRLHRDFIAFSKPLSDLEALKLQQLENEERTNESAWEQAIWYSQQLERGYFKDQQSVAMFYGLSKGDLSELLRLVTLPKDVIAAFSEPEAIRRKWARALFIALDEDREAVLERARTVRTATDGAISDERVFNTLVRRATKEKITPEIKKVRSERIGGKVTHLYTASFAIETGLSIRVNRNLLDEKRALKLIRDWDQLVEKTLDLKT